jgi:hypothetical protein
LAVAGLLVLALSACQEHAAPGPAATGSGAPAPEAAASARRPARRYFLGRTASRCEIYRVDGAEVSPATATPCPVELQIGERMRIAGKTCVRESSDPERVEPVVCPDPLTDREKRDLGLIK